MKTLKIFRKKDQRTYYIVYSRKNKKGIFTFWKFSHKAECAKPFSAEDAIKLRDALLKKCDFDIEIIPLTEKVEDDATV